jgi:predicted MFS family arabinose efflux permease
MHRALGSVVREYVEQVQGAGRNARLYLAGLFLIGFGQSIFSLLFNLYLRALGFSDAGIGQIISKISLGAAVAAIPAAFLFRSTAARVILVAAGALCAAISVMQATLTEPELMLVVAFISGMALTVYRLSIAPVVMSEVAEPARPFLFSAAFTVLVLAAILGSAVGGFLPQLFHLLTPSDRLALRYSLFISAAATLLCVIPFNRMRGTSPNPRPVGEAHAAGLPPGVLIDRRLRGAWQQVRDLVDLDWGLNLKLVAPAMLIGLGAGLIIPFLNLYFRDRFGLSEAKIGLLFSAMQAFMVAGNLFGPAVSRRMGLVRGVVVTQLVSVPFMVALALSSWFPIVAASFFLRSALMNMNQPLSSHFAMEVVPKRDHAITNSLLSLSWYLAWSVSADVGGALIERKGYTEPLLIAAALYIAASALYWYFFKDVEEGRVPRVEVEIPSA